MHEKLEDAMDDHHAANLDGVIVFDIETDSFLNASRDNFAELQMTACVLLNAEGERYDVLLHPELTQEERAALLAGVESRMDGARFIVAYNGRGFDLKIMANYFEADRIQAWATKLIDPFEAMRNGTGSWVKLDELLAANGVPEKTATGAQAVAWWREGQHKLVLDYCFEDTRGLLELVRRSALRFPVKAWSAEAGANVTRGWATLNWARYVASALRVLGLNAQA